MIRAVRREFADVMLMVDANSAYTLNDTGLLRQFDEFNLMMIEQPLAHDDIVDHAVLQKAIETPICLDESIHSTEDARKAIGLGACQIINIKTGRVGGLTAAKALHDLCADSGIPVWCGGMLETGIGRAHNIAMSTLPNFVLPGDTAPSANYWAEDIIVPEVTMNRGVIDVPDRPGMGFDINHDVLDQFTLSTEAWIPSGAAADHKKESTYVS
jgi:O-succinylbenzoate synthase